jgi:hypothetical protein
MESEQAMGFVNATRLFQLFIANQSTAARDINSCRIKISMIAGNHFGIKFYYRNKKTNSYVNPKKPGTV